MIETAQNVADRYGLTREEIDAFALRSHHHAAQARDRGHLAKEIVPVTIPATRYGAERLFEHDETIRDDTSLESLAKLPAQPGTTQMSAGNSTPLSDGSSAVVIASDDVVAGLGVAPLARIVGSATHALEPGLMGVAPAWAITSPSRCGSTTLATAFSVCARAQGRVWPSCSRTANGPGQGSAFDGARRGLVRAGSGAVAVSATSITGWVDALAVRPSAWWGVR